MKNWISLMKFKIQQTTFLGTLNILLALFSLVALVTSDYDFSSSSITALINAYTSQIILFSFLIFNSILSYKLLSKNINKKNLTMYKVLTYATPTCFLIYCITYFFASQFFLLLFLVMVSLLLYYFLRKISHKFAIIVSLTTLSLSLLFIVSGFEEDYCSRKGFEMEKKIGNHTVVTTKEDAELLKSWDMVLCCPLASFLEI